MKKHKVKRKFIRKWISIVVLTYSTRYGRIIYQTFDVDINPIQEVHVIRKQLSQSSRAVLETRGGMGLPISIQVARTQTSSEDLFEVKSAPTVSPHLDKIKFVKPSELHLWVCIMDERVIRTPKVSKLIKELRGGSLIETVGALIVIVVMYQIMGVGIEGFQIPIVHPNGGVHRPANGGIQQYMNHPKHGGRIRVRMSESNQCPAHQTQVSGFVKNGKVDLRQCYDEVMRRSKSLDCENFSYEFERFKSLSMENGRVNENSAREAITVLYGEILEFYKSSERKYYGEGVYGPNFKVTGQRVYSHVTHVEVKNPVGSDIEKTSRNGSTDLVKQGSKIGDKLSKQQSKWSNATFRAILSNIDPNAAFPQTPANTLGLVDEFDLPISEKLIVQNAVENTCTNTSNVIFINNETNI